MNDRRLRQLIFLFVICGSGLTGIAHAQQEIRAEAEDQKSEIAESEDLKSKNLKSEIATADDRESDQSSETPTDTALADHKVAWLHQLKKAKELSRTRRAPILVIAGATWCGPCRILDKEIEADIVQNELQRWIPVHVDVDQYPDDATELAANAIPALRILSPDGRLIASMEGVMTADALTDWLSDQFSKATDNASTATRTGPLNAIAVLTMLKDFRSREATIREAAISRLAAVPQVAAAPVVTSFSDSSLSEQLALLELLSTWGAPISELDPWIPDTVTPDRVRLLEDWVTEKNYSVPDNADELSAAEIIEARRILRQLLAAEATEAAALREHLARMGRRTLPLIRQEIENRRDSPERRKLMAARYRVAATAELNSEWPGGIERLAAADHDKRIAAVSELTELATAREEPLLLELFSDPSSLVREISLQGLTRISGTKATGALVRLLDDPDPNVRAAVLKQLAEAPVETLIPQISDYARNETDPDLVVHAVRFLREIRKPAAVKALSQLFNHASWRVRAEAADGIYRLIKKSGMTESRNDTELGQAFLNLLQDEDEFVVGVAIRTLRYVKASDAADRLVMTAEDRPAVAAMAVTALGQSFIARRGIADKVLDFTTHNLPDVRAAANVALFRKSPSQYIDSINEALADEDRTVRMAVADAIFVKVLAEITSRLKPINTSSSGVQTTRPQAEGTESSDASAADQLDQVDQIARQRGRQIDESLSDSRQKRNLAAWVYSYEERLKHMQAADEIDERLTAGRILALLGHEDGFQAVLEAAKQRTLLPKAVTVFPGLTWAEKTALFDAGAQAAQSHDERYLLADSLADSRDNRAPPKVWELLAADAADARLVAELSKPLQQSYYSVYRSSPSSATTDEKRRLKVHLNSVIETGTHWQKTAALQLLASVNVAAIKGTAEKLLASKEESPALRADALRIVFCYSVSSTATDLAVQELSNEEMQIAEAALQFLALGQSRARFLSGVIPLPVSAGTIPVNSDNAPISVTPPDGMTVESLARFSDSTQSVSRVCAAYFRTLLGSKTDVQEVVQFWQRSPQDIHLRRMAYRAITVANDATYVPQLQRMFRNMKASGWNSVTSDFYWTISNMTGPEIMDLLRQIREVKDKGQPVPLP